MNILKWLKVKNPIVDKIKNPIQDKFNPFIFKYFYLQWYSNKKYNIIWTNIKPKKYNYEITVNLKNYDKIIFIGDIHYNQDNYSLINSKKNYYCKNNQFLKSHLQKCIRRGKNFKAICTAYQLLENNPNDFLRRFIIIILEDVHIIKDIDIIVWFMVMSSYIKLPESFKKWILFVVNFISLFEKKNFYSTTDIPDISKINNVPIIFRSTLYSLIIRIEFGGMKGDMKMINNLLENWIKKLNNGEKLLILKPYNVIIKKTLEPDLYEISAFDFHCYKNIINLIREIYPNYEKNLIKRTIWVKSSSINFRENNVNLDKNIEICWNSIQVNLYKIQKKYIRKYIWSN